MIVVDSSAIIAILEDEADASTFAKAISDADACLISSVSLLEVSIVLAGRHGDRTSWQELDDLVASAPLQIRPHDAALTDLGREAFIRFGKGRHPAGLNFGDCASYALAKSEGAALLFKGHDFSKLGHRRRAVVAAAGQSMTASVWFTQAHGPSTRHGRT